MSDQKIDDGGLASQKTLRDYFAAKAMRAMIENLDGGQFTEALGLAAKAVSRTPASCLITAAYGYADAMIAERKREP